MKLTKKLETEIWKIYDTWMQGYLNADVETYNSFFDEDYHFIGSTNNEEFLNRKDTTDFFRATGDQFAGMTDLREENKTLEVFGEHVFLTHFFDAWFKNDKDWSYYGRFRFSSVMHKTKEGWRFIYQHFSMPDSKSEEGQTIGFDKVHLENQELREAIQRRTTELEQKNRELEVETALERIRSQAVAMKESSDLLDIVVTMRNEFIKLGHEAHYFWHMMWLPETYEKAMTSGDGSKIGFVMQLPRHIHGDIPLLAKWEKSKKPTVVYTMNVDEAIDYVDKMVTLGNFQNIDPQAPTEDDIKHIGGLTFIMARTTHGEIGFSLPGIVKNPPKEDIDILVKFAGAFDLAHQRFLDLQKAEKQAKETQIELSLERIRSRVTAMQKSSDLFNVVVAMRKEFISLGHQADYFWHMQWLEDNYEMSMTSEDGNRIGMIITVPKFVHKEIPTLAAWEKSKKPSFVLALNAKEAWDYIDKMNTHGKYKQADPHAPTKEDIQHIGGLTFIIARTTHGEIGFSLAGRVENPPKASIETLVRFAQVFDLAYKRFEDLQKAEVQARETQIDLALEKVRSRTMGMQRSDELRDTAMLLFQQVEELGINSFACGFNIWDEDKKFATAWMASKDRLQPPFKTNSAEDVYVLFHEAEKRGESLFILEQKGKELEDHYKYLVTIPEVKKLSEAGLSFPTFQIIHCAYFSKGYLMFITLEPVPDAHAIFKRFAKVFEQTYTRFLDLQKAEKQAREKEIELALEKVRSRTMAMQHSDELQEASFLLDQQVRALGIKTWGCAFNIYGEKDSTEWFGNEAGVLPTYTVPRKGIFKEYYQKGKKGESFFIKEFSGKACVDHYEYMSSLPVIGDVLKNLKKTNKGFPTYQIDHVAYFKYGYLLFITKEHVPEAHDVFKRFAKVFQQTYTRFLDLQTVEAQAREAQIEATLERVRSRSMAMHNSNEIGDVAFVLFEQLKSLGGELWGTGFGFCENDSDTDEFWFANENGILPHLKIPNTKDSAHKQMYKGWKDNLELLSIAKGGKELKEHYNYMLSVPDAQPIFQGMLDNGIEFPNWQKWHAAYFKYGYLLAITTEIYENEDIFKRFAKVFEQAYTRFLDLQKAEAQAREAQIEAALERVRARSMGMHSSSELKDVIREIFDQMGQININAEHAGIVVDYKPEKDWHFWVAETQDIPAKISVPYLGSVWDKQFTEAKKSGSALFTTRLNYEEKNTFYKEMLPHIEGLAEEMKDGYFKRKGLAISTALQRDIALYIENFSGIPYTDEENAILLRFAKVFQQTYTRFLDLQTAEAQAKEAQIEAALERVRSQSMGMQSSNDFSNVTTEMFNQLRQFGGDLFATGIVFCDKHKGHVEQWHSLPKAGMLSPFIVPVNLDYIHQYRYDEWKKGTELFSIEIPSDFIEQHFQDIFNLPSAQKVLKDFEDQNTPMPKTPPWEIDYGASFKHGYILVSSLQPFKEAEILPRFAKVFEQTYTRFLDLQKAEAQAREAQIEAALEKVRSRTMAMQKGEELKDVVVLLYKELIALGVTNFATCGYVEINEKTNRQATWVTNPGGDSLGLFYLPLTGDVHFDERYEAWKKQQTVFHQTVAGKERKKHLEYAITTFNSKEAEEMVLNQFPDPTVFYCFNFSHGYLHLVSGSYLTKKEESLLARFTRVFEQTYARFLDLEKAEAQVREAQIEAALEKVRSRSLAMHNANELKEVVVVIVEKLKELGVILDANGITLCTYFPDSKDVLHWIASPDFSHVGKYLIPYFDHLIFKDTWKSKEQGDAYFSKAYSIEEKNSFFEFAFEHSDYKHFPEEFKQWIFNNDKHILSFAWQKNSAILIPSNTGVLPTEDEKDILIRFSKVFEQAYIRFMDLEKAEAQAREAQIETALEKVRSRTMAMQHSDELPQAANNLFLQVQALGIPAWSAGYNIWQEDQNSAWCSMSSEGEVQRGFLLPSVGEGYNFLEPLNKGDSFYVAELGGEALIKHYDFMGTLPIVGEIFKEFDEKGIALPTFQIFHIVYFSKGFLMFITYESVTEDWDVFKRFGNVFEQTYTRFLDLKLKEDQADKLEKEKQRLEKTLKDLQDTQKQLIHSEKMASLGELTAGIAHEIQNPLNFVNNFSEVSKELLDEMIEELENGDMEEVKAITDDVIQNLEKINHHGKRADGIVKGMLQHSRASGDKKEPTDINVLADEYLRLAYHGLRAKDKSFNATLKTNYDDSIENINIIPQDIGRVVLNLLTNAFYVVNEKKQSNQNGYEPTVALTTKKNGNWVTISVKDNGNGIPKKVLSKIFQPFFTTKPTGEGTGLGLSMSYDIITKGHGGELEVVTKDGKGTEFIIHLPL